ncbi:MAG TPA: Ger(x)C family spore germination protein [Ruminiclostridium sp.]|nr:Ger(x)C family spore germination protein [Ruminiclostridium sp.]
MGRKIALIILIVSAMLPLASCFDAREIDSWAYVYTMGVDKGVSDKLRMTIQFLALKEQTGGGSQGGAQSAPGSDVKVITIDCPTFYSGVNMINSSLSRRINYMHSKFFIVSQELAKEDISSLMSAFVRDRQIRRTMHMIVVRGKADDFINSFNPILGTAISKTQEGIMDMQKITGLFEDTSFGNFIDDMKSDKIQPVGVLAGLNDFSHFQQEGPQPEKFKTAGDYYAGELPRNEGNKTEFFGTALFNGGKMIGELNGDETRALLMLKGKYGSGSYPISDPSQPKLVDTIIIRQQKKPQIKITFKNGKPVINEKIFLEGDLQAVQSDTDFESPAKKPILEKVVKEFIKKELDKTISKCKSLNCDSFGFGEKASLHFLTIQRWEGYRWLDHFKDSEITVKVEFIIRRTGTLIKTNKTIQSKE